MNFEKIEPNSLHLEHLNSGFKPIITCLEEEFDYFTFHKDEEFIDLDFTLDEEKLRETPLKNSGERSYLISPTDTRNKKSSSFINCTGIVVSGVHKETGEEISFVTHQDPSAFLEENDSEKATAFERDLKESLQALKDISVEGSVDAVIFGGKYMPHKKYDFEKEYIRSIEVLTKTISEELGFKPVVVGGPKKQEDFGDSIFYETKTRRLHLFRPKNAKEATFTA